MNRKQLSKCKVLVGAFIGVTVALSVSIGNILPAIAAILVGAVLSYACSRRMTEVVNDEMVYRISEKASRRVVQIFTPAIAFIGLVIVTLKESYPDLYSVGLALAYSACSILILYVIFYSYYSRRGNI
jgi:uncharacterized membrane protein